MPQLKILDASGRRWTFQLLAHAECKIGRAPDNDVVLTDSQVSRFHALIKYENDSYVLVNCVSRNHIFRNDSLCLEERLFNGDRIRIGNSELVFEFHYTCYESILTPDPAPVRRSVSVLAPAKSTLEPFVSLDDVGALPLVLRTDACHSLGQTSSADTTDVVVCSVFSPLSVNTTVHDCFIVQVFAHLFEQSDLAKRLAQEFDETAKRRGSKTLETEVLRGSRLSFHLAIPTLEVNGPVQTLVWHGRPEAVQFAVRLPPDITGNKIGTVTISQDAVPIGQIVFSLRLDRNGDSPADFIGEARVYKKAFISYASGDRDEVLKRVQMLSQLQISFFQDLLSLEPGQRWEQELYRHIDESDLFLLFWSSAAKASEWVMNEVRYAIKRKDGKETSPPAIVPVIIEGPPPVPPPAELAHLHFNDYLLYLKA